MNKFLVIVVFVVIAGSFLIGCDSKKADEGLQVLSTQAQADKVVSEILYIKDLRTGICFAYYWGGTTSGGPALTTVRCENVPAQILIVAK